MKRSDAYPSSYMNKDDIAKPTILRIGQVRLANVGTDSDQEEKPAIYWEEPDVKPMILNQANWATLEDAYGEESDDWRGKPVEVYVDKTVMFAGRRVGGIRLRIPHPAPKADNIPF